MKKLKNLFNTISIETSSLCHRKCWFCPNAYHNRPEEYLDIHFITSIADQLKGIKYSGRVEFYQYNEPLKDPRIIDIIKYFRLALPNACLMIATSGDHFTGPKDIEALYRAGLNQLQINIYSNRERFNKIAEWIYIVNQDYAVNEGNIYLYSSPKTRFYSLEEKYISALTPASPKIGRFELTNRSGLIASLPFNVKSSSKVCPRPFRFMQINWKGEVVVCCNDYYGKFVCGSIFEDNILHIWYNSVLLNHYRKTLLTEGRKTLELCEKCSFTGAYTHLIAPAWKDLL